MILFLLKSIFFRASSLAGLVNVKSEYNKTILYIIKLYTIQSITIHNTVNQWLKILTIGNYWIRFWRWLRHKKSVCHLRMQAYWEVSRVLNWNERFPLFDLDIGFPIFSPSFAKWLPTKKQWAGETEALGKSNVLLKNEILGQRLKAWTLRSSQWPQISLWNRVAYREATSYHFSHSSSC